MENTRPILYGVEDYAEMPRANAVVCHLVGRVVLNVPPNGGERFPEDLLMNREQYKWFMEKATNWLYDYNGRLK